MQILTGKTNSEKHYVVSEYITNPLLINGIKFDMRVYVLVTGLNPLKIYVYRDGLARFCSEAFSLEEQHLSNRFAHLTNYSINKFSDKFRICEDGTNLGQGTKCLISHLEAYISPSNYRYMFDKIEDIVVKTLISAENTMFKAAQNCVRYRDSCFEILGFDFLLDSYMNPWLLEVNTSPSFATDSKLDYDLKGKVLTEAFNIVGVNRESEQDKVRRYKVNTKLESFLSLAAAKLRKKQQDKKDQAKTKRDYLIQELREELNRSDQFKLVYPGLSAADYAKYFEEDRPTNRILRNEIMRRKTVAE